MSSHPSAGGSKPQALRDVISTLLAELGRQDLLRLALAAPVAPSQAPKTSAVPIHGSSSGDSAPQLQQGKAVQTGGGVASAPAKGRPAAHKGTVRDWNKEVQELLSSAQLDKTTISQRYAKLVSEFVEYATPFAQTIIREEHLPNALKSIKSVNVGGVAGGEKFIHNGIFFKFTRDFYGLYRSESAAQKVAGHELRGLAMISACGVDGLYTPIFGMIRWLGRCICVTCALPLSSTSLVYGSEDGGVTVVAKDPVMNERMAQVGRRLNLARHCVGKDRVPIHVCGDLEGHLGTDQRYYVIDAARLFPPLSPNTLSKLFNCAGRRQERINKAIARGLLQHTRGDDPAADINSTTAEHKATGSSSGSQPVALVEVDEDDDKDDEDDDDDDGHHAGDDEMLVTLSRMQSLSASAITRGLYKDGSTYDKELESAIGMARANPKSRRGSGMVPLRNAWHSFVNQFTLSSKKLKGLFGKSPTSSPEHTPTSGYSSDTGSGYAHATDDADSDQGASGQHGRRRQRPKHERSDSVSSMTSTTSSIAGYSSWWRSFRRVRSDVSDRSVEDAHRGHKRYDSGSVLRYMAEQAKASNQAGAAFYSHVDVPASRLAAIGHAVSLSAMLVRSTFPTLSTAVASQSALVAAEANQPVMSTFHSQLTEQDHNAASATDDVVEPPPLPPLPQQPRPRGGKGGRPTYDRVVSFSISQSLKVYDLSAPPLPLAEVDDEEKKEAVVSSDVPSTAPNPAAPASAVNETQPKDDDDEWDNVMGRYDRVQSVAAEPPSSTLPPLPARPVSPLTPPPQLPPLPEEPSMTDVSHLDAAPSSMSCTTQVLQDHGDHSPVSPGAHSTSSEEPPTLSVYDRVQSREVGAPPPEVIVSTPAAPGSSLPPRAANARNGLALPRLIRLVSGASDASDSAVSDGNLADVSSVGQSPLALPLSSQSAHTSPADTRPPVLRTVSVPTVPSIREDSGADDPAEASSVLKDLHRRLQQYESDKAQLSQQKQMRVRQEQRRQRRRRRRRKKRARTHNRGYSDFRFEFIPQFKFEDPAPVNTTHSATHVSTPLSAPSPLSNPESPLIAPLVSLGGCGGSGAAVGRTLLEDDTSMLLPAAAADGSGVVGVGVKRVATIRRPHSNSNTTSTSDDPADAVPSMAAAGAVEDDASRVKGAASGATGLGADEWLLAYDESHFPPRPYMSHLFALMRPELVQQSKYPLSSDSFSFFGSRDPNFKVLNAMAHECTRQLFVQIIPSCALHLYRDIDCNPEFVEQPSDDVKLGDRERETALQRIQRLNREVHAAGINFRYFGLLRRAVGSSLPNGMAEVPASPASSLLLTEMAARCFASYLSHRWRQELQPVESYGRDYDYEERGKVVAAEALCLLFDDEFFRRSHHHNYDASAAAQDPKEPRDVASVGTRRGSSRITVTSAVDTEDIDVELVLENSPQRTVSRTDSARSRSVGQSKQTDSSTARRGHHRAHSSLSNVALGIVEPSSSSASESSPSVSSAPHSPVGDSTTTPLSKGSDATVQARSALKSSPAKDKQKGTGVQWSAEPDVVQDDTVGCALEDDDDEPAPAHPQPTQRTSRSASGVADHWRPYLKNMIAAKYGNCLSFVEWQPDYDLRQSLNFGAFLTRLQLLSGVFPTVGLLRKLSALYSSVEALCFEAGSKQTGRTRSKAVAVSNNTPATPTSGTLAQSSSYSSSSLPGQATTEPTSVHNGSVGPVQPADVGILSPLTKTMVFQVDEVSGHIRLHQQKDTQYEHSVAVVDSLLGMVEVYIATVQHDRAFFYLSQALRVIGRMEALAPWGSAPPDALEVKTQGPPQHPSWATLQVFTRRLECQLVEANCKAAFGQLVPAQQTCLDILASVSAMSVRLQDVGSGSGAVDSSVGSGGVGGTQGPQDITPLSSPKGFAVALLRSFAALAMLQYALIGFVSTLQPANTGNGQSDSKVTSVDDNTQPMLRAMLALARTSRSKAQTGGKHISAAGSGLRVLELMCCAWLDAQSPEPDSDNGDASSSMGQFLELCNGLFERAAAQSMGHGLHAGQGPGLPSVLPGRGMGDDLGTPVVTRTLRNVERVLAVMATGVCVYFATQRCGRQDSRVSSAKAFLLRAMVPMPTRIDSSLLLRELSRTT